MNTTFDPEKRAWTLATRGLDFARSPEVFEGRHVTADDLRFDYGEARLITAGYLDGRIVIVVWTRRSGGRRIISMRKANDREQTRFLGAFRGS